MDDVLNDALSNLEHDNYERSHKGYENRQADIALIRAALAAQPAASAEPSDMAHEIWAAAQLAPGEGIEDGAARVEALLSRYAAPQASAEVSATPRPTDDELWDQTLRERDEYHDMADQLAAQIAAITGEEIGEHSSANDPWRNAMLAADDFIAAQLRKLCTAPAAQAPAKGADVALPTLPRLIPVEHYEKQQAMREYARAAVLADRQQRGGDASEWIALKAIAEYPTPGDGSMSAANMREIARKALMAAKKGKSNG